MDGYLLSWFDDFASCDFSLSALHERVRDALEPAFRHNPNFPWVDLNQVHALPQVHITREHVRRAHQKSGNGEISERELTNWATMIVINNIFYWKIEDDASVGAWVHALCLDLIPTYSSYAGGYPPVHAL